ncbi:MAG: hypothetical protein H7144_00485 [Burkholderiales bacterium]|nr:hypothetical protein [Phycisphaerae bacterium]
MTRRIAGSVALITFALCLIEGLRAENSFTRVVLTALLALVVTLMVGLVIGVMAEKMLKENLTETEKSEKSSN